MNADAQIKLTSCNVVPGRMVLKVELPKCEYAEIGKTLAAAVGKMYPTIYSHSCINSRGPSFGHCIAHTNLAHLLEHMIIEEQLDGSCENRTFVGTTTLSDDGQNATVEVNFFDDLKCAEAVSRALKNLNALLQENWSR